MKNKLNQKLKFNFHKLAFTLAEVLLVLGIVGVVGVLAVSNAKKDTDEAEKVAQLRRSYEILSSAFAAAVADNGRVNGWSSSGSFISSDIENIMKQYFKFVKVCGSGTGCWRSGKPFNFGSEYSSGTDINSDTNYFKGILANGSSIAIKYCKTSANCDDLITDTSDNNANYQYMMVFVDVNGPKKGLHTLGNDIFAFRVLKYGEIKPYVNGDNVNNFSPANCRANGIQCTAWAIQYGNMDYLKNCYNSLSWNGTHTCRD